MQLLKDTILREGTVKDGNIIKVDSFLNHQLDVKLFNEIGKEIQSRFSDCKINKILTIEASGIGIATIVAQHFDFCPVVFAKKSKSKNLDGEILYSKVESFTKGTVFDIQVAKKFINESDNILIIDDFLANGQALLGLIDIIEQTSANLVGCCIIIEKGFQSGGEIIRKKGIRLESLAIIDSVENSKIILR
ncbi:MAG: xanthine phosphoribosyltransferase [Clostridia bacterium]